MLFCFIDILYLFKIDRNKVDSGTKFNILDSDFGTKSMRNESEKLILFIETNFINNEISNINDKIKLHRLINRLYI